ncbi:ecdysone 20-monooxygenase isoform X2 [Zophobas morio]
MFETFLHLDLTSLLIILIFFLFLEYRPPWWYRANPDCKKGIPGPLALPIVGTTWMLFPGIKAVSRLHEYYQDMYKKYGPIMKEEYWCNIPIINLFEKRDIVKVLKNGSKYPLRPPVQAVAYYRKSRPDRYTSTGLVNEQGEAWHHLRTTLTPVFTSPKTISSFLPSVREIADDWCNLLKQSRDSSGLVSNLDDIADRLGLEITCALILGRRMGFLLPGGESDVGRNLAEAVRQHFIATRDTHYGIPFWRVLPTSCYNRLVKSEEAIYDLAMELIKSANDSTKDSEVFQAILKADLDEKEKTAAIIDFMSAGIHTLKNSLLFLLYLVGRDSDLQRRIMDDPRYSKACMTECFRLCPTANCLARILDEEMELGGYRVPAGTPVVCHFGIACRDERNFKDAATFKPERWLGEETNHNAPFLLIPFGVGRRVCPGKRLIEHILPVLLQHTVSSFEFVAQKELEIQYEFILAPKGKTAMVFRDRV